MQRDTDSDWRLLGEEEPYWAVLTHPQFKRANADAQALERFYASGRSLIGHLVRKLEAASGAKPGGRALDFGCGVGRLTEAMCDHATSVCGYDISPGMLAQARQNPHRADYVSELPDGPFDWINSYIVFQHIPADRGVALLEALLASLAEGGHLSLQLTIWRDEALVPPPAAGDEAALLHPPGTIMMYDYGLSDVMRVLHRADIHETKLVHTDHGGHHGVEILARRERQGR